MPCNLNYFILNIRHCNLLTAIACATYGLDDNAEISLQRRKLARTRGAYQAEQLEIYKYHFRMCVCPNNVLFIEPNNALPLLDSFILSFIRSL